MPVEHVSDRCIAGIRLETGVPKRFAVTRVERDKVSGAVAAEEQVTGRRKKRLSADVRGVFPGDLARLDVDGAEFRSYDTAAALVAGVTLGLIVRVRLIEDRV